MAKPNDLTLDQLLYNAAFFLLNNDEQEAARLLIECEFDGFEEKEFIHNQYSYDTDAIWTEEYLEVTLSAPSAVQEAIGSGQLIPAPDYNDPEDYNYDEMIEKEAMSLRGKMAKAFEAVLRCSPVVIVTHLQLSTQTQEDWREHLRKLATGEKVSNQGLSYNKRSPTIVWERLNFRSQAEKKIAQVLDKAGVLYLPNCTARLGKPHHRHNKEPDFLICLEGKWGILEVDGKPFHQEAARDHERDRQFRHYGITTIERFDGRICLEEPDTVVETFLSILRKNG